MVNVGFIGCGNMGSAIMKGILSSKMSSDVKIFAYDKSEAALDKAIAESTIKETIDVDFVNEMLVEMRKKAYNL